LVSKQILIVEDGSTQALQLQYKYILKKDDYGVSVAKNGPQALQLSQGLEPFFSDEKYTITSEKKRVRLGFDLSRLGLTVTADLPLYIKIIRAIRAIRGQEK